jgi:hypothetical protein
MQILTCNTIILFSNKCQKCEYIQNSTTDKIEVTVTDLVLYTGIPICEMCGTDLPLLSTVRIVTL